MSWALQIAKTELSDSSARHVLLCLANYASADGRGTFHSVNRLSEDTGLSERTVRYKLDLLREAGWIVRGNQALAAVYIDQHDRRPVVYDLQLLRGANAAPKPPLNHQVTEEQLQGELAGVIAEQDQQALDAADDRQRYAMFAKWEPAAKALADQLAIAGLPSDALTDEVISGFKGYHVAKPSTVDSAAGWCFRLASWIKRERVKTASAVVQAAAPGFDDDDTSWINGGAK